MSEYLQAPIKTTGTQALSEVPITQTYKLICAFIYLSMNYKNKKWENVLWEENQMRIQILYKRNQ